MPKSSSENRRTDLAQLVDQPLGGLQIGDGIGLGDFEAMISGGTPLREELLLHEGEEAVVAQG